MRDYKGLGLFSWTLLTKPLMRPTMAASPWVHTLTILKSSLFKVLWCDPKDFLSCGFIGHCINAINHFICYLLFAYLSINCTAYRHQQAYGSIYVAYHQQRDHAHSAQTGLHGVDQSIYFLTNEVNLHRFSRHTCPSLTSQQCAAAQWLKNNGLVWGGGLV